jgi:pimeloyl-ACP methyl ester carboxylesterase
VGGHLVRFRALGDGPAVLLVHGLGGSSRWWEGTAQALGQAHRVILPELPGFGFGGGSAPFRLAEAPEVLAGLLERLGIARAHLVGHSLGALACAGLAARAPHLVGRLVMIAPPVRTAGAGLLTNALPALRTVLTLPAAAAVTVAADIVRRSPLALLRAAGELLVAEHARELASILAPTLLLWGERDVLVPAAGARELEGLIGGARLRLIPGAGHVPMLDRPEAVIRELRGFLAPEPGRPAPARVRRPG